MRLNATVGEAVKQSGGVGLLKTFFHFLLKRADKKLILLLLSLEAVGPFPLYWVPLDQMESFWIILAETCEHGHDVDKHGLLFVVKI